MEWVNRKIVYWDSLTPRFVILISTFNMSKGEQLRDYVHVEDMAKAINKIHLDANFEGVINCCSGKPVSIRGFVEDYVLSSSFRSWIRSNLIWGSMIIRHMNQWPFGVIHQNFKSLGSSTLNRHGSNCNRTNVNMWIYRCLLCGGVSSSAGSYSASNSEDQDKSNLYKCSRCSFYFFERTECVEKIYVDSNFGYPTGETKTQVFLRD